MRFIIYGVGAIGGTFAASLSLAGYEVVGIARGRMLEAIRANGLMFRTPDGDHRVPLKVVGEPSEIGFRDGDVVLLTMKSQDTVAALQALRAAGLKKQAVVCAQNGIDNEREALRFFPNVYGMTVMMPSDYVEPGVVVCYGAPRHGICDIGRFPAGLDETVAALAEAVEKAGFAAFPMDAVQRSKRGKLLENLGNVIEAALEPDNDRKAFHEKARAEAVEVFQAAGITDWVRLGQEDPRRKGLVEMGPVAGTKRAGSSSTQSLQRGAGSIETDYLNGEIVLLARLHGKPAPVNTWLAELGQRLVSGALEPRTLSPEELRRGLGMA